MVVWPLRAVYATPKECCHRVDSWITGSTNVQWLTGSKLTTGWSTVAQTSTSSNSTRNRWTPTVYHRVCCFQSSGLRAQAYLPIWPALEGVSFILQQDALCYMVGQGLVADATQLTTRSGLQSHQRYTWGKHLFFSLECSEHPNTNQVATCSKQVLVMVAVHWSRTKSHPLSTTKSHIFPAGPKFHLDWSKLQQGEKQSIVYFILQFSLFFPFHTKRQELLFTCKIKTIQSSTFR